MTIDKRAFYFTVATLWALAILSVVMFFSAPARADDALPPLRCFVGASAGTAAMATKVDSVVRIDVGGTAPLLSAEAGCKINSGSFSTMGILRADLQRLGGSLDNTTLQSNARYQGVLAVSFNLNDAVSVYVGPSLTASRFSFKDIAATNLTGYGVVAGVETDIGKTGLRGFVEYGYTGFKSFDVSGMATAKPAEQVLRLGVRLGM